MDLRSAIATRVRAEMARQHKSQRDVAGWLGIAQQAVCTRLQGKRSFRAEELKIIGDELGVPVATFMPPERVG